MPSVPTVKSATSAGSSGVKNAGIPALGAFIGNTILPGGLGTAVGGIAGSAAMDGSVRTRMSETAVFVGATQLGQGMGGSNSNSDGQRGKM